MKPEDVKFEGAEPSLSEEELLAPLAIDQLVTTEINTTLNTLKLFLGIIVLIRMDYHDAKFKDIINKVLNIAPVLEQVLKRSIDGFQAGGETHQTMQLVMSEMKKGDFVDTEGGVEAVIKTLSRESGNA